MPPSSSSEPPPPPPPAAAAPAGEGASEGAPAGGGSRRDPDRRGDGGNSNAISQATYPLPGPLVQRIKAGVLASFASSPSSPPSSNDGPDRRRGADVDLETYRDALGELVANAIEAIDSMYFTSPARVRPLLQHRLCLRVKACPRTRTLSVADLGVGMTRSDLINSLGIGKGGLEPIGTATTTNRSSQSKKKKTTQQQQDEGEEDEEEGDNDGEDDDESSSTDDGEDEIMEEDDGDDDDDDEEVVEGGEFVQDEDDLTEETNGNGNHNSSRNHNSNSSSNTKKKGRTISCRTKELGGFYAALCALGTGIRVSTKSRHDDYYLFQIGHVRTQQRQEEDEGEAQREPPPSVLAASLETFTIARPYPEGHALTAENGFDGFEQVRGESGTCVTIGLNDRAVEAGLLRELEVLQPIFLKLVETTQYQVAFSYDEDTVRAILDADANEARLVQQALREKEPDYGIADIDLQLQSSPPSTTPSPNNNTSQDKDKLPYHSVLERSKYIPLRLSLDERKMLRLVEACMTCCDYTTRVDRPFQSSARRTHTILKNLTGVLRGLVTSCDYRAGQVLNGGGGGGGDAGGGDPTESLSRYERFFRQMFEIARRHKIMNPEKMRTEYGKMVYLLQDAVSPQVRPHLSSAAGATCTVVGPVHSVHKFLQERGGTALLSDPLIGTATEEILAGKKPRAVIENEIRQKERAVAAIKRKYATPRLSEEDIHLCLYSVCDNNSFLNSNRVPIDKIIDYLETHFDPSRIEAGYSLSIVSGTDGARLSHSHERQYYFALQSLTLWRDIVDDMFRLWAMAEEDLLSTSVTYNLQDTGQGYQRVQQSPRTYKAMQSILNRVQNHKVGRNHWVGSSVIHLGDHNVPNALSFIDKYTQVPRILGPIVACLENVERIYDKDDGIRLMIDGGFGGLEKLRKDILYDFFRGAFDGSGADNFYDAGSCIDGRLTSAWNWCSQLPNKPFYPIFKLTGFIGFDGEFK